MRRNVIVSIILLLTSNILTALPVIHLSYPMDIDGNSGNIEYQQLVYDTLYAELKGIGFTIPIKASIEDSNLSSDQTIANARELGADVAVTGIITVDDNVVQFSVKAFHIDTYRLLFSRMYVREKGFSFFSAINDITIEIRELLEQDITLFPWDSQRDTQGVVQLKPTIVHLGEPEIVRFYSKNEGMLLKSIDGYNLGSIENGFIDLPFIPESSVIIVKEYNGFTDQEHFYISKETHEIHLRPVQFRPDVYFSFQYNIARLQGAGGSINIDLAENPEKRGWHVWGVSDFIYTYQSYQWIEDPATGYADFTSYLINDIQLFLGAYTLGLPSSPVRHYIGCGLGYIMGFNMDTGGYKDTLYLTLLENRLEFNLWEQNLYIEYEANVKTGAGFNPFPPIGDGFHWPTQSVTIGYLFI